MHLILDLAEIVVPALIYAFVLTCIVAIVAAGRPGDRPR